MTPGQGATACDDMPVSDSIVTDAVVIGAGPVGLFQVFELGLLDIRAHVVDALPHVGGQLIELYPDKPIYDVPGLPGCTGRTLADALLRQAAPFQPQFHLEQTVSSLEVQPDGRFLLSTSKNIRLLTRTVFIAAGVGAFEPRRINLNGIENLAETQLIYHTRELQRLAGQNVAVIGDSNAALETAVSLATDSTHSARKVTLIHRRDSFRAEAELVKQMRQQCDLGHMQFVVGLPVALETQNNRLTHLQLSLPSGCTLRLPTDCMCVLLGLSPQLGPLTQWGLDMERKLLQVDTETFSTSIRGIFAVGDVNSYPGKRKLLVCGFHEATLAAYAAAPIVYPERAVVLQYTTSSSHLQTLLRTSYGSSTH